MYAQSINSCGLGWVGFYKFVGLEIFKLEKVVLGWKKKIYNNCVG